MISTGGSFFSGWRMVRFLTTILPKSAERRKPPPFEPTHVEKAQLQKKVERTLGWLNRSRRLSKDYEHDTGSSEAMVHLAMIHLMLKRLCPI